MAEHIHKVYTHSPAQALSALNQTAYLTCTCVARLHVLTFDLYLRG